jgi:hypothetical protein
MLLVVIALELVRAVVGTGLVVVVVITTGGTTTGPVGTGGRGATVVGGRTTGGGAVTIGRFVVTTGGLGVAIIRYTCSLEMFKGERMLNVW